MARPGWLKIEDGGKRYTVNLANVFLIGPAERPDEGQITVVSTGGQRLTLSAEASEEFLRMFDGEADGAGGGEAC